VALKAVEISSCPHKKPELPSEKNKDKNHHRRQFITLNDRIRYRRVIDLVYAHTESVVLEVFCIRIKTK